LMNLIRGSGVDGLSGMKVIRKLEGESTVSGGATETPLLLVRPLLSWAKRKDTETYCHDAGVGYRYDTMNEDTAFKRVRIRKVLLPLLEDMNPNIVDTLANTAELMQHLANSHVAVEDDEAPAELDLKFLKGLGKPDLYRTVRSWLKVHRGTTRQLELKHIQAIERLIFSQKSGKTAELPGDVRVVKSGGKLAFDKN
jgi:tRNA(Ile)-lysidine synthase